MMIRKATAAAAALVFAASPLLAQAAAVRPGVVPVKARVVAAKPAVAPTPAGETIEDASRMAGVNTPLGIVVALAIIGAIIYIAVEAGEDDDEESPG